MNLAKYIDHTLLKADATKEQIDKLCAEAAEYKFKSVCINPAYIKQAKHALEGTEVEICTVIGFPLGANSTEVKVFEAKDAVASGATEIDMVINISRAKDGDWEYIQNEIKAVVEAVNPSIITKVIIETSLLTDEEKVAASKAIVAAGANFVKTSTGFSTAGATLADVELIRETVGPDMDIKASGGVSNKEEALAMIEAGATRIGASKGIKIVSGDE